MREYLPERFKEEMKALLGDEYQAYLDSFDCQCASGLRINTLRWTPEQAAEKLPALKDRVPWTDNGFYYDDSQKMSKHPYYSAGLYYLQEPSAMAPARLLPVEPGDRVLDLCAAPGGKSTELGARLKGKGLLFANDISSSRAKGLLKNLELFGISNMVVASEAPEKLAAVYPEYFDKILVDAPCSGEGMFRKEPDMVKDWMRRGPEYYAPIQQEILGYAVSMLRPGGFLLYSTCTFSVMEDEENVRRLMVRYPEMEMVSIPVFPGASGGVGLSGCLRLFPHRVRGEGHFLALLRKKGGRTAEQTKTDSRGACGIHGTCGPELAAFLKNTGISWESDRFMTNGDHIYYLPEGFVPEKRIRYLRTGLYLGNVKKGRFEPSQALAMALGGDTCRNRISFGAEDDRVIRYLKGETIPLRECEPDAAGWCLVCVDGFPLGFARGNGRSLKNKYYPGWRWV